MEHHELTVTVSTNDDAMSPETVADEISHLLDQDDRFKAPEVLTE